MEFPWRHLQVSAISAMQSYCEAWSVVALAVDISAAVQDFVDSQLIQKWGEDMDHEAEWSLLAETCDGTHSG